MLVYSWKEGKHPCVDFIWVSSLSGLGNETLVVGQAAIKATEAKMRKHDQVCKDNQHLFIPFVFDTFIFLTSDDVEFQ